jgi:hypothetical protein
VAESKQILSRMGRIELHMDLAQQQHAAVASEMAAGKVRLHRPVAQSIKTESSNHRNFQPFDLFLNRFRHPVFCQINLTNGDSKSFGNFGWRPFLIH